MNYANPSSIADMRARIEDLIARLRAEGHMVPPTLMVSERVAAAALGLRPQRLRRFRSDLCGPKYVKFGDTQQASVRYSLYDLLNWIDERSANSRRL